MTVEEMAWVRSKVGTKTPPTDADLDLVFDRVGSTEEVVREVLDTRLADLRNRPAQFAVVGEYSEDVGANIAALEKEVRATGGGSARVRFTDPCPLRPR
jgi:hypothetical protein